MDCAKVRAIHAGIVIAAVLLLLLAVPPAARAAPAATITPASGPRGTTFITTCTGLTPERFYRYVVRDPAGATAATPRRKALGDGTVDLDPAWVSEAPEPFGVYTFECVDTDTNTVVASGTFTVTDPDAPAPSGAGTPAALPAAGGGGMATGRAPTAAAPVALGLAGLAGLLLLAWRRRPGRAAGAATERP